MEAGAGNGVEFEEQWLWIAGEDDLAGGGRFSVLIDERPANAVVQLGMDLGSRSG